MHMPASNSNERLKTPLILEKRKSKLLSMPSKIICLVLLTYDEKWRKNKRELSQILR